MNEKEKSIYKEKLRSELIRLQELENWLIINYEGIYDEYKNRLSVIAPNLVGGKK